MVTMVSMVTEVLVANVAVPSDNGRLGLRRDGVPAARCQ